MNAKRSPAAPPKGREAEAADGAAFNYISHATSYLIESSRPLAQKWAEVPPQARIAASLLLAPLVVLPFVMATLAAPWITLALAAAYSALYGYKTFTLHLEEALQKHFDFSPKVGRLHAASAACTPATCPAAPLTARTLPPPSSP